MYLKLNPYNRAFPFKPWWYLFPFACSRPFRASSSRSSPGFALLNSTRDVRVPSGGPLHYLVCPAIAGLVLDADPVAPEGRHHS
ncbi:MAG: hypothetical protein IKQ60_02890 [Candidatus Methanomethylophilaceae archaeon]|nr:hypothetical protein [Candidatus Methanomethylophilaceae archaeon]